jgi:NAD(P)-dependent dehydrogenase (short-subunit alcohol dehydrogenase family)
VRIVDSEIATLYHSMNPRYPELRGQVAVVTGAAQGIGRGIAIRLAREGMRVVLADKKKEVLASTTDALLQLGATVLEFLGDLSQSANIKQLFDRTIETFKTVHLLVNNAADLQRKRLLDAHEALLDHQLANNIRGPYLCSYHAAKIMRVAGGGNIIHISSVGAIRAHLEGFPYDVTKGAINAMTRAMAIDLAEYNIRVNAIGPGVIRSYRTPAIENPNVQEIITRIPLQRSGTVSDIGSLVAFLASEEASYVTGQVIYVDGGITAQLSPPGIRL